MPEVLKEFLRGAINALILSLTGIATLLISEKGNQLYIGFLFIGVFFLILLIYYLVEQIKYYDDE